MQKLGSYDNIIERSVLPPNVPCTSFVELNTVGTTYDLMYKSETITYGVVLPETTYKCNVTNVLQGNLLCWAATTACIVNYVKDTNYDAQDVLVKCGDIATGPNYGMDRKDMPKVFQRYGMSYQYKNYVPTISIIEKNIKNDYPMFGSFYWGKSYNNPEGGHSGTIYGCTTSNQDSSLNCIYVMDPQYGAETAMYSSGTYKYIAGSSGYAVWLISTSCMY